MNALAHRPISLAVLVVASALLADSAGLDGDPSLKAAGAQEREGKIKANGITIAWEYQRAKHRTIKVPTVVVHGTEVRLGTSWKMGLGIDVEARLTDEEDLWLDSGIHDPKRLEPLLVPFPAQQVDAYPRGRLVNDPGHDAPECIQSIETGDWLPGLSSWTDAAEKPNSWSDNP